MGWGIALEDHDKKRITKTNGKHKKRNTKQKQKHKKDDGDDHHHDHHHDDHHDDHEKRAKSWSGNFVPDFEGEFIKMFPVNRLSILEGFRSNPMHFVSESTEQIFDRLFLDNFSSR